MNRGKIPVFILSGFLGSGKTTVLLKMIEAAKRNNQKPGVILNELGETNVESHLFEDERVHELLNGCICCTIQDDLKNTLSEFISANKKEPVDVLFIEGTGVANPVEIKEAVISAEYIDYLELKSIISLVDASHYLDYQSIFSSSKEIRTLLKEQISSSTLVVLNKVDLVEQKELSKIESKITAVINEGTPIFKTSYGEVPLDELFMTRVETITFKNKSREHHHHHHHHHATIQAMKIEDISLVKKRELEAWLKSLPKEIIRGKGIIRLMEDQELHSFQFSSGKLITNKMISNNVEPSIILIGSNLNIVDIKRSFESRLNK